MGLRDWANKHTKLVIGIVSGCVVISIAAIVIQMLGNRHLVRTSVPEHYYSIDDGKSFFTESAANVAPFDYKGKIAVRAYVFECGGKPFVGYLERYTPEARKRELGGEKGSLDLESNGRELKKPGETKWTSSRDRDASSNILQVACPDGSGGSPTPIEPL